jgi:hypothetical protein
MDESDNQIKPAKNCPKCGATVTLDILYHGPGADGFEEICTKCTWSRERYFTEEGVATKENL